jgi:hypothetical protein
MAAYPISLKFLLTLERENTASRYVSTGCLRILDFRGRKLQVGAEICITGSFTRYTFQQTVEAYLGLMT